MQSVLGRGDDAGLGGSPPGLAPLRQQPSVGSGPVHGLAGAIVAPAATPTAAAPAAPGAETQPSRRPGYTVLPSRQSPTGPVAGSSGRSVSVIRRSLFSSSMLRSLTGPGRRCRASPLDVQIPARSRRHHGGGRLAREARTWLRRRRSIGSFHLFGVLRYGTAAGGLVLASSALAAGLPHRRAVPIGPCPSGLRRRQPACRLGLLGALSVQNFPPGGDLVIPLPWRPFVVGPLTLSAGGGSWVSATAGRPSSPALGVSISVKSAAADCFSIWCQPVHSGPLGSASPSRAAGRGAEALGRVRCSPSRRVGIAAPGLVVVAGTRRQRTSGPAGRPTCWVTWSLYCWVAAWALHLAGGGVGLAGVGGWGVTAVAVAGHAGTAVT